ncbi:MAG: spore coat protein CotJB [Clostridiales bacterium]|nr:spore coat protein CotJB [Clostridiales bacterium]
MNNRCEQLMQKVYENGFAVDDILLYLDTHPDDEAALQYYYYVRNAYLDAKAAYEQNCGPLTVDREGSEKWSWVNGPWPWEGGKGLCGNMKSAYSTR